MIELAGTSAQSARRRRSQQALDMRVTYIPRPHKLLLVALAAIILAAGIWGWTGSVPTMTTGEGIILPGGQQIYLVQGSGSGRIARIAVGIGDRVSAGEVVAEVAQPALQARITAAEQNLAAARSDFDALRNRLDADLKARQGAADRELALLTDAETQTRATLDRVEQEPGQAAPTAGQGSAAAGADAQARQQVSEARAKLLDLQIRASRLRADLVDVRAKTADRLESEQRRVRDLARTVTRLEAERDLSRQVRAPVDGTVREVRIGPGQTIGPQDVLMTVASRGQGFEVLAFLASGDARRATPGMAVHVVPATVKEAEFGTMKGRVTFISETPLSLQAINDLLRDPQLAQTFTRHGEPYLARIALAEDRNNPSGFEWWSGKGPPFQVAAGTLANVDIVLREEPPIALVVPALRELLGL